MACLSKSSTFSKTFGLRNLLNLTHLLKIIHRTLYK
ncbi:unnamed protein product [Callosobruchus maculatus]|uniref:Uncharacterized protein n=1 Tax=Callosobruchus maculatus TaxID=64391 RepID=A0A653C0P8_CALMS|nr:unnamed protein product [Callosobruchus maculatus]VEN50516.1 unnamed protein product [Callosobruchus maculatus]